MWMIGPLRMFTIRSLASLALLAIAPPMRAVAQEHAAVSITRGGIRVPERYTQPRGRTITLAYVRLHGSAPSSATPIVYLAGGPGGSGISDMLSARFAPYRRWLAFADIIAFDQRGTGASSPSLACPGGYRAPLDKLQTRARVLAEYRALARSCGAYWRAGGVKLSAYSTESSADDVAALARQLGYRRIRLFGASYGSHLGLSVIRRHPNLVERAVFGAIEGPDDTVKLPADVDTQLDRVAAVMRKVPAVARALPDFAGSMRALIARADRAPLAVGRDQITGFDLRLLLGGMIGRRGDIEQLPALFGPALHGDYDRLAAAVVRDVRQGDVSAMGAVMDCASSVSARRWATIERQVPRSLFGTALDFPLPDWCDAWGIRPLPASFRSPVVSSVPTLFIAGDLDGQTPPHNAEEARRGFRNGRLFLVHRAGHDPSLFLSSPGLFDSIAAFMAGKDTPDRQFDAPELNFSLSSTGTIR